METLYYSTEYYHQDNTFTMNDFLENKFLDRFNSEDKLIFQDGSYAEVLTTTGEVFAITASGNGDSFNHRINFRKL